MILLPAIDLFDKKAVRLYKGDYQNMTVYSENPIEIARDFESCGARYIHMVDLEGAKDGTTPNIAIVQQVARETSLFVEIGGGIHSMETVERYLNAGVSRVILGTAAVNDEAFLRAAVAAYGDKIAVGADVKDGYIAIKGWLEKSAVTLEDFLQNMEAIGVKQLKGETGYSTLERNSCRPSFDVCGIWGGYTGEGSKTVLPSKAFAKVSCRLVPYQDHETISKLFVDYINQIAPEYVQVKVTPMHGGEGYVCPISLPAYQAAEKGFTKAFGKKPLAVRRGGSIPIISDFERILGIKTVLMGFGLESDAIHSPNENFSLDIFRKGIEAVVEFHQCYSNKA